MRTQYRHMPNQRKNSPIGPMTPKMPQESRSQKAILAVSILPRNTGVMARTSNADVKKSLPACRVINHSSLNQFQIIIDPPCLLLARFFLVSRTCGRLWRDRLRWRAGIHQGISYLPRNVLCSVYSFSRGPAFYSANNRLQTEREF